MLRVNKIIVAQENQGLAPGKDRDHGKTDQMTIPVPVLGPKISPGTPGKIYHPKLPGNLNSYTRKNFF